MLNQIYVQQFNDQVNQRVNQYLRSRGPFNDNATAAANWLANPTSANDAALMNYKQSLDPNVQAEMAQRYPQYGAAPGQQSQSTDIRESGDMSAVLTAMQEYMNSMRGLRYEGWGGQNGVGPGVSGPAGLGDEGYGGSGTADGGTGGMW